MFRFYFQSTIFFYKLVTKSDILVGRTLGSGFKISVQPYKELKMLFISRNQKNHFCIRMFYAFKRMTRVDIRCRVVLEVTYPPTKINQ